PGGRGNFATGRAGAEGGGRSAVTVADVEKTRLDALRGDRLAVGERHLEAPFVEGNRGVDVLDRDSDVVDSSKQGGKSMRRGEGRPRRCHPPLAGSRPSPPGRTR